MLTFETYTTRVVDLLGLDLSDRPITPDDGLYTDLALDSFQALQLIVVTEAIADISVPPVEIPELFSAQDAYDYYVSLRNRTDDAP